jgi:hypothetical protein
MHWTFKLGIIGGSAWLIIFYFGIYPYRLAKRGLFMHKPH